MKLVAVLLLHLLFDLCRGQCESKLNETTMFNNAFDALDFVDDCDFSTKKFNATCVNTSCPQLLSPGLCPYTSTGSLNLSSLSTTLSILNSCFQQKTTICDTPLSSIGIPQFSVGLTQVFSGLGGWCTNAPNNGIFNNVQNVAFAISPDQSTTSSPLNVVINAPGITLEGAMQCSMTLLNVPFTLPDVSLACTYGMTPAEVRIDFQDDQPKVQVNANNFTMSLKFGNFVAVNSLIQLPTQVESLLNAGITAIWKISGNPTAMATFYATFVAFGIKATKQNCP